ncbi:Threonine/homoserine efflux transporter RhtA [Tindallia magadiensis]|uniref:Threonine/homoserine efflux transporter RhtA n=1 Tax=Tindallia magadiensis TaxID=69895 RepID=A0A1I3GV37_9FIRM|nr:EamA family transporter [Tindallia magadiensis]SFI27209.1 Threonine/homoserine efflux transporter RhtA [Tindallia magadiensis]
MRINGVLLVILAAILWGLSGGLGGFLMDKGWSPLVIAFYRGTVGLLFILTWFFFRPSALNRPMIIWSIFAGIGVAGNLGFYNISISESSIAVAATLMYTAPVFVFLISFIFRLEEMSLSKWLAILFVMAGVVLLTEVYHVGPDSISLLGLVSGLASGISYALFIFSFKYADSYGQPQGILSIAFISFSIVMLLFIDRSEAISVLQSSDIGWMIVLGFFGAGLSFFLYITGLKRTTSTSASIAAMVEPVTASLFGFVVLSQTLAMNQIAGMGIILVTVTSLSTKQSEK